MKVIDVPGFAASVQRTWLLGGCAGGGAAAGQSDSAGSCGADGGAAQPGGVRPTGRGVQTGGGAAPRKVRQASCDRVLACFCTCDILHPPKVYRVLACTTHVSYGMVHGACHGECVPLRTLRQGGLWYCGASRAKRDGERRHPRVLVAKACVLVIAVVAGSSSPRTSCRTSHGTGAPCLRHSSRRHPYSQRCR